jgi:flavin reductase (DIM6/NTAB) family NADH-FMN oxidoreductase RutF
MQIQEKILDAKTFKSVLGRFATGVTIVTVQENDTPHGMTVNAFSSVSLDPLLVLVCLEKDANTTSILQRTETFSVNILADHQEHLSKRFAMSENEMNRFDGISYTESAIGTPVLDNTLGYLSCTVRDTHDAGDHLIFIGEVVDMGHDDGSEHPLVYFKSRYRSLQN